MAVVVNPGHPWSAVQLRVDPLPALLACEDASLVWRVCVDLLGEASDATSLWTLPRVAASLRRQQSDGSWRYAGRRTRQATAYEQLATYGALLELVEKHGLDARHSAFGRAAKFLLDFQTEPGDLRGMYGNQFSPNYTAAIVAVLLDGGHPAGDPRIEAAMRWLVEIRQDDGGWAIPFRTMRSHEFGDYNRVMRLAEPVAPDRSQPFSHFVTGIVLRAFAAHPNYRDDAVAHRAASLLATRLFRPDRYPDRRAASYWTKLRYPFRWTDVVSALDAMRMVGTSPRTPAVADALAWLADHQTDAGLWRGGYPNTPDPHIDHWVTYAVARLFRRGRGPQ